MYDQLILLLWHLEPVLPPQQYLSLAMQLQQRLGQLEQTLSADQWEQLFLGLICGYFDVHLAVEGRQPVDAVVSSLQHLFSNPVDSSTLSSTSSSSSSSSSPSAELGLLHTNSSSSHYHQQQQQGTTEVEVRRPLPPGEVHVSITNSPAVRQGQQQQQQQQPAHPQMAAAAAAGTLNEFAPKILHADSETQVMQEAMQLAKTLMKQHGLGDEWRFGFNSGKRICGACCFDWEWNPERSAFVALNSGTIQLSTYYVTNPEVTRAQITNTILHEIAHAR
jgi:hypothetical protein